MSSRAGLVWGFVTIWFVGKIHKDVLMEITLTVSRFVRGCFAHSNDFSHAREPSPHALSFISLRSTYLLFYVAEDLCEVSGVLAIVTLGASFVWYGKTRISPEVQHR